MEYYPIAHDYGRTIEKSDITKNTYTLDEGLNIDLDGAGRKKVGYIYGVQDVPVEADFYLCPIASIVANHGATPTAASNCPTGYTHGYDELATHMQIIDPVGLQFGARVSCTNDNKDTNITEPVWPDEGKNTRQAPPLGSPG